MKYKTAFRLAVRAIGLLVIAQSIPWFVVGCAGIGLRLLAGDLSAYQGIPWEWVLQQSGAYLVMVLAGLYLFFRAGWIVDLAIPSNRPYCHECAYELTGLPPEGICPECGTPFRRADGASRPVV